MIKDIVLLVINYKNQSRMMLYNEFKLKSKVHFYLVKLNKVEEGRVVINSKLVMNRPIISRVAGNSRDIFHG